jgi:thiosulfate reductase cytochrome b subunit
MTDKLYIHPLPIRLWHWTNAFLFIALIVTGVQIRYIGQIDLGMKFGTAVRLHNYAGFALIAGFGFWLLYHLFSRKMITRYHTEPDRAKFFDAAIKQAKFYAWGILVGDRNPQKLSALREFNPLQSVTYQVVLFCAVPIQSVTGVLLWDVKRFQGIIDVLGGVRTVDTVHVVLFVFLTLFVIAHAYLGSLGPKPGDHFKEMFTGYEEGHEPDEQPTAKV